ncbi:uncharacterized protein LOC132726380 [Ruditapes philippinarum]|uniref:uncharacterized protein LOC132726380 n=1 Tax=Ruditapes philippinarum TaxID=129788 RepID=UPI00295B3701|nr:uncharacterized protein LOC132726380 [Ruditapes philippinarum]
MAHQLQLEKDKYRQWVKAGLGLGYLKEGLVPFCNDIADQQHKDILQNIRSTKSLPSTVTCGSCGVETLKPDHMPIPGNAGNKVCPLGQVKCSCCFKGKIACPNNICGAIYDFIVQHHSSSPPAPNWKNTDAQQWMTDPWSICKCFINAPGYEQKQSACETDCTGLLILMINNQYFHSHIGCNVTGTNNLFSKVRQYRNNIFHSSSMELEESEANSYIDDMIVVLQDGKELLQRSDAQIAVKKLQDLKKKDFIISTESFEEILRQIKEEMAKVLKSTENAATKDEYDDLKKKLLDLETKMSDEEKGKLENEKELAELKKTITELEFKMTQETLEKAELKKKLTVLEILVSDQKEEIKRFKVEDSPQQKQLAYEKVKSEWRKKLIEQYHKTLLQVPTTPLQPKSKKCSFNEIYIRPKITREINREKGETEEVEVKNMSEILTMNGVPQKSIYVLGDAGSGKTSFCKYLVNCWCLAHSEEHEVDNENEDGSGKPEVDSEKHGGDGDKHGAGNDNEDGSGKPEVDSEKHEGDGEKHEADNENEDGSGKPEGDREKHGGDGEKHEADNKNEDCSIKPKGDSEKHGGDSDKHGAGNDNEDVSGKPEGDSEKHGGDGGTHGAGNENEDVSVKTENCSMKHEGDDEKHGGVNEIEGDREKHGRDNEEHENHVGVNENASGSEEHGCDYEEHETQGAVNENEGDSEEPGGDNEEHEKKGSDIVNEEVKGTKMGGKIFENPKRGKRNGKVLKGENEKNEKKMWGERTLIIAL